MKKSKLISSIFLLIGVIFFIILLVHKDTNQIPESPPAPETLSSEINSSIKDIPEVERERDFPPDMELLTPEGACIPELTHFDYHFFVDSNRVYTEKDLEVISEPELIPDEEYLAISSSNSMESVQCVFHSMYPAATPSFPTQLGDSEVYTVYKMQESNLYVGTIYSKDDKSEIIGKIMVKFLGVRLANGLEVSFGYFDETEFDDFYALNPGYYEYKPAFIDQEDIDYRASLGKQIVSDDYSNYSGVWYSTHALELAQPNFNSLELNIQSNGQVNGYIVQKIESSEKYTFYGEADLYGHVSGGQIFLHYDEDGYGHNGELTITPYEYGLTAYLVEHGKPSWSDGFFTGDTFYFRE